MGRDRPAKCDKGRIGGNRGACDERSIRHLGIGRVKALGLSGGGIVLLHMATAASSPIESMVIVSAPPYFPSQARASQRQPSEAMLGESELALMRKRHPGGDAQIAELLTYGRAFADSYDDVAFTPPLLSTIAADTLIVFGDRDPLYPVSPAFELHTVIPRSCLWVVPNAGHVPVFGSHAPQFAASALSFLRGEWGRGSMA